MKKRLLAISLGLFTLAASAYWVDTPLETLAANSELVVIGTVKAISADTNTHRLQVTMGELLFLKGNTGTGKALTFDAPFTLTHCVQVMVNGQRQYPLDSFATNEVCAVFLRQNPYAQGQLQLIQDDDGKFAFDRMAMRLHKAIGTSATNHLSFETFQRVINASPVPVKPGIVALTVPIILTNLPIQLVIPRALSR